MLSGSRDSRFSLLLLDEDEYYFDDFGVTFYPLNDDAYGGASKKLRGRLKLCSKSVLLDLEDVSYPIVKVAFEKVTSMEKITSSRLEGTAAAGVADVFALKSDGYTTMMENGIVAPYVLVKGSKELRFNLNYGSATDFKSRFDALLSIARLPPNEADRAIKAVLADREATVSFDASMIESLSESILLQTTGGKIAPLVNNPGIIVLTTERLYFQPFNNVEARTVESLDRSRIVRVEPRRHVLRNTALEIFLEGGPSVMFSFKTNRARDQAFSILEPPSVAEKASAEDTKMTLRWRNRLVSNYDYLLWLNTQAGRSFSDLTQYPVFPWVIADYESATLDLNKPETYRDLTKPIGALNPERLQMFKDRYAQMPKGKSDPPAFLYGTHYSSPGYVLYYRLREVPELMLKLQSGKYDAPDRMFDSIAATWHSVLHNAGDVKELIPEFYSGPASIFRNERGLDLGLTQAGRRVNDVILPPWAKDAEDFLAQNRAALESEAVSSKLHCWIDLIFGYKQQGIEAIRANNLFYYLTYEGAVDIEAVEDIMERTALEIQIKEFGQTPKQIFTRPHPARIPLGETPSLTELDAVNSLSTSTASTTTLDEILANLGASSSSLNLSSGQAGPSTPSKAKEPEPPLAADENTPRQQWPRMRGLRCTTCIKLHKEEIQQMILSGDGKTIYSVSTDGCLKMYSLEEKKQVRSSTVGGLALGSMAVTRDQKTVLVGSWDNHIHVYSIALGRATASIAAHDAAVSSLVLRKGEVFTSSWDSEVKNFKVSPSGAVDTLPKTVHRGHDAEVRCLDVNFNASYGASGDASGHVLVWRLHTHDPPIHSFHTTSGECTDVCWLPEGDSFVFVGEDGVISQYDVEGSAIFSGEANEELYCVLTDGVIVLVGGESGRPRAWSMASGSEIYLDITGDISATQGSAIKCLEVSQDGRTVLAGFANGVCAIFEVLS